MPHFVAITNGDIDRLSINYGILKNMRKREREGEKERVKEKKRKRERERKRERKRKREGERKREKEREGEREKEREGEREKERERESNDASPIFCRPLASPSKHKRTQAKCTQKLSDRGKQ